jgi:hypothetical protein
MRSGIKMPLRFAKSSTKSATESQSRGEDQLVSKLQVFPALWQICFAKGHATASKFARAMQ